MWLVAAIIKGLVQRPGLGVAFARIIVPVATLLLALANFYVQRGIATANAGHIVRACETYRDANGRYPDRLDQLVPQYLSSIPVAKYCCWFGEFRYFRSPEPEARECHSLCWYLIPPFGTMIYDFEKGKWGYVD